jgi:multicomponent Na+:H+ antiporter subunit C
MNNYYIIFSIIVLSILVVIRAKNNFKKIIALAILQNAIWLFYMIMGVSIKENLVTSNPLSNVLMLTAIVVGISTLALAIALMIRIKREE